MHSQAQSIMARIYVASSWRNKYQPEVNQNWQDWQPEECIKNLIHPVAEKGFKADMGPMLWANTCVMVLPCGRSAHAEAEWFAGKGLKTTVYMPEKPELMYKLFDRVIGNSQELVDYLQSIECK